MATSNRARVILAGYVAGLMGLDERAGAEIMSTTRNGSGSKITIEFTADAIVQAITDLEALQANDDKRFTKDQLRSIGRALDVLRTERGQVDGVTSEPAADLVDRIKSPLCFVHGCNATEITTACGRQLNSLTSAYTTERELTGCESCRAALAYDAEQSAVVGEIVNTMNTKAAELTRDEESQKSNVVVDTPEITAAKRALEEAAARVDAAEQIQPRPKNLAALKAAASKRRLQLDRLLCGQGQPLAQAV
jgi:hypothetical protein